MTIANTTIHTPSDALPFMGKRLSFIEDNISPGGYCHWKKEWKCRFEGLTLGGGAGWNAILYIYRTKEEYEIPSEELFSVASMGEADSERS